jgi:hypothetical protein
MKSSRSWWGDRRRRRGSRAGPAKPLRTVQTEDVQYKLDGLVLLIEGTSRDASGKVVFFRALGRSPTMMRNRNTICASYNDVRYLDTELEVTPNGFAWGYEAGPLKVRNTMRLNGKGEWVETTESQFGSEPQRTSLEMRLKRQP